MALLPFQGQDCLWGHNHHAAAASPQPFPRETETDEYIFRMQHARQTTDVAFGVARV